MVRRPLSVFSRQTNVIHSDYHRAVPVCPGCSQLVEGGRTRILCPHCRTALRSTTPISRRIAVVAALVMIVAAIAVFIVVIVHRAPI